MLRKTADRTVHRKVYGSALFISLTNWNLLMKNRVLFFRENSIFRKLLFELQTVFEGFAHSFVYQIVAMCIWVECNGID